MGSLAITGTLRNAQLVLDHDPRAPCLRGNVYGDAKGRFGDGEVIITSKIAEHLPGGIFRTRYSAYRVESWL